MKRTRCCSASTAPPSPTRPSWTPIWPRIEEAKKRDHRKLGRELDLFDIRDEGPGFPFFYPKGMILRNCLEDYWREMHREAGYEEIKTPMMLNRALWERSGHWDHYKENMYTTKIDDVDFAIKPMNCPGGILVYKRKHVELPRPAHPLRRAGPGAPPRAVRRAARPDARALLHAGRRPHLHDPRPDPGRDQGRVST